MALFLYTFFHNTNIQTELTNSKPKNKSIFSSIPFGFPWFVLYNICELSIQIVTIQKTIQLMYLISFILAVIPMIVVLWMAYPTKQEEPKNRGRFYVARDKGGNLIHF